MVARIIATIVAAIMATRNATIVATRSGSAGLFFYSGDGGHATKSMQLIINQSAGCRLVAVLASSRYDSGSYSSSEQ